MLLVRDGVALDVPDPLHLQPWEEKDEPLASDLHYLEQDGCVAALRGRFAGPRCYVTRDRWLLMDPANRDDKLLPDLLVALDVPDALRKEYDPTVEGKPPDMLAEWLSESSHKGDVGEKLRRYRLLGVREYLVFNPEMRWGQPRLQGWALRGELSPVPLALEPDGSLRSRVLPVRFAVLAGQVEPLDGRTGRPLTRGQGAMLRLRRALAALRSAEAAREREAEAREREAEARRRAEAEAQRLREELERLRRERDL